jgi:hypothetical protein
MPIQGTDNRLATGTVPHGDAGEVVMHWGHARLRNGQRSMGVLTYSSGFTNIW